MLAYLLAVARVKTIPWLWWDVVVVVEGVVVAIDRL